MLIIFASFSVIQKLLLLPEIERPDKLDCFDAQPAAADSVYEEKAFTSIGQSTKLDIMCDNGVTLSDREATVLNNKVVVDHLSASWTLVSDNNLCRHFFTCLMDYVTI